MIHRVWTLLQRDLAGRRLLFAGSILLGVLAGFVPALQRSGSAHALEVRTVATVVVALLWGGTLAVGLGATMFARELNEGRLGFDFRLPLSNWAICSSRLLAAYLTVGTAVLLVMAGAAPFGLDLGRVDLGSGGFFDRAEPFARHRILTGLANAPAAPVLLLAPLALLLLANLGGLALFGRRAWSVLDLVSLMLLVVSPIAAYRVIRVYLVGGHVWLLVALAVVIAVFGLLAATAAQLLFGRTELDRAHRSFSIAVVGTALLVLAATSGFSCWFVSPSFDVLFGGWPWSGPIGDRFAVVSGPVLGRPGAFFSFLVEPSTKRSRRLGATAYGAAFGSWPSNDGPTLAWLELEPTFFGRPDLRIRMMTSGELEGPVQDLSIHWVQAPKSWALSPDGSKVVSISLPAGATAARLLVEETANGRLLRSMELDQCRSGAPLVFLDPSRVRTRCYQHQSDEPPKGNFLGYEVNIDTGRIARSPAHDDPRIALDQPPVGLRGNGRLLRPVLEGDGSTSRWEVVDERSGAILASLDLPIASFEGTVPLRGRLLTNALVLVASEGDERALVVVAPFESEAQRIPLPRGTEPYFLGESTDGKFVFLAVGDVAPYRSLLAELCAKTYFVDLERAQLRTAIKARRFDWFPSRTSRAATIESCAGVALWFAPETATLEALLGRSEVMPIAARAAPPIRSMNEADP